MNHNSQHFGRFLICAVLASLLCGCTMGPDFLRPFNKANDPQNGFINAALNEGHEEQEQEAQSISLWWERINDPLLNKYVETLLAQNLQLSQAAERVVQAQARSSSANSDYFPSLGAQGDAGRSFTPNTITNSRTYSNSYGASLQSSWQIDLFGKIRRSVEAADASLIASLYDRDALVHSLIAELLNLRVEIAVDQQLLELAQKNAQNRRDTLEIVERRYELGAKNTKPQDVLRARANLDSVQADVNQYQRLLADASYRLDVLLGQVPGTTDPLATPFPIMAPPVDVPVCLPVDLLDRRPDLRASELRVKAANADVGVAIADLYPALTLGGSLGFTGDSTNSLFSADQLAGSLLSTITSRIFEGGALRANIDIQKSEARELAAVYADNVLQALREVETNLKAEHELDAELSYAESSTQSLSSAENILQDRYLRGIDTLQDLLDAQRELYTAQQSLLSTHQAKWKARTSLYLALGGDWFNKDTPDTCLKGKHDEQG